MMPEVERESENARKSKKKILRAHTIFRAWGRGCMARSGKQECKGKLKECKGSEAADKRAVEKDEKEVAKRETIKKNWDRKR